MAKCSAPNCLNSQKRDSLEYSFYEFPHDSDLRARWIANIGRPNWTPGRRSMICSSHFEKSQLKRKGQHNHLLEGAVPTLFQLSRPKRARINKGKDLSSNVPVQPIPPRNSSNLDKSCVSVSFKETNHPPEIKNVSEVVNTHLIHEPNTIKHEEKPAPEKLPDGYVFVDADFTLKDCEVVETNVQDKSTGAATDGSSTKSNNYSVAGRQENIKNIESTCGTSPKIYLMSGNSHSESDNVVFIQEPSGGSEAVFKQVLNLTNIATPRTFIDASDSDVHMLDSMPVSDLGTQTITVPPLKRCKLSVTQGDDILLVDDPSKLILEKSEEFTLDGTELVSADNFVSESYSEPVDQLLELNKSERPVSLLSSLPIKKGVVDIPVSLTNHKLGGHGRNHSHSSYKWLDGTFMCRLCGVASNKTINLFSDEASEVKVLERIYSILPIMIMESDHLPQNVCSKCLSRLDICSELIVNSFNTQEQLASVMDQDVKQSYQMPVSFHGKEIRTSHDPNWKKHILLMEIYHEQEKPLNEYLSIAYHDLHARLNPETRETQCNLVLATITDNCSVSQVEQVRTAAEALVSSELIHEEANEETKLFHHQADTVDEHENDEVRSELSGGVSARLPSSEHFQYDELCPTEIQAMPVVDDASPVEFDPANVRCTKFQHFKNDYEFCFNNMQNVIYWGLSKDKEVHPACSICKKGFDRQSDIQKHLLSHANMHTHLEENLDITRQVETTSQKVWKSIRGKRFCPWYQCSFCSERCKTRLLLKQHLQQQHAANAKCEACGYVSSDVCEATNHRQLCPQLKKEKDWRCRKCLESFSSQMDLQTHQASSGHENNVPSWLCDVCGKRYAQAAKLNQHKKSHLTPEFKCIHQCPLCPKRYINSSRLKEHMQKHEEKKYMCKVCGKLFSTKQILRQHEFTHGDPQFMCSLCSRTFFRKSHLLKHMNVHNPANIRASRAGPQPHRDGLNRCRECKKVFDLKELLAHYKVCHPDVSLNQYVCEICQEENTSYAELFQHQREVHKTGVKDCPFCGKTIDSSTQMKYHLMRHEGMFPYNCPLCSNGYTANSVLQDHIRRKHTGEKPFECQQCSKRFPTNGALAQHSTVHSLPHQLLPCPVCNQGFKRKAHLDVHLRTHTGEKPYPCPVCDRPFRQRPDCLKHIRVIHGEDPSKFNIRFHPNMCVPFPQIVSVTDMELVLDGEDLMQTGFEGNQVLGNE